MRCSQFCLTTIAVIALNACGYTEKVSIGHLLSNGAQDSVIDDQAYSPTDLVGWSNSRVIDRFGSPEVARTEGSVVYWRYVTTNCLVDVYLSQDTQTGDIVVDHMAVRPRSNLASSGACPTPPKLVDPEF